MDPANSCTVYLGTSDGKILQSTSCTALSFLDTGAAFSSGVSVLTAHPTDTSTVFAGLADGRLFRKTGSGSWILVTTMDGQVSALVYEPGNGSVLYAGTAHASVYKSTDGGTTFARTGYSGSGVTGLSISPATKTTMYAGATTVNNPPASITATSGTPQSALLNTAFGSPLAATVMDSGGNPASGATVTFTAPASGPSGVFGSAATATATTNGLGQVTSPIFTANGVPGGSYNVTATVGTAASANFSLTNTVSSTQPSLVVTKSHQGNFVQGQQNVTYTVTVTNVSGAGSKTAGASVTVSENVPSGLTVASMAGTGWACGSTSCTRSDALIGGASYPPITVTANVAANASSPQVNQVGVSGGGSVAANATDPTVINTLVTIQTSPAGLQFSVDGGPAQTAPQTLNLAQGTHTVTVVTTQAGPAGTQYLFTGWSDSGAASHAITVGSSAATYTASFKTQYQLTISASPLTGGTVTPASGGFYDSATVVSINATANTGYSFATWSGSVASPNSASTSVTMGAPQTVVANFSSLTGITIQTNPAGLQFSIDGGAAQTAPQTLNLAQGTHTIAVVTTQAGPAGTQYVFTGWSDAGAASHSINVGSSAATYTASLKTQYQLTISASPVAGGSVTPASGGFYDSATVVPINGTANTGYSFAGWSGSAASPSSASTSVTMGAPRTVTANFSSLTGITIQTNPAGLQFSIDGGAAQTAPQTLNLSQGTHTVTVAATQAGSAGTQYVFTGWSDAGAASHTITVGSSDATYTASFKTQYQLTISASPAAGGTVTPASGGFYDSATVVPINATVNTGYSFASWSGSVASPNSASTSVTMGAPQTLTANFSPLTGITIQTNPPGLQFSVDGGAAQTAPQTLNLSQGSHTIAVAATQAGGVGTQYVFTGWSDAGAASHTITVGSSAATYTASFKTQHQLTISALPVAGGTVTPASGGFYDSATVVPINATANTGYSFASWSGSVANPANSSTTVSMSGPQTVVGNFAASGHPSFFTGEVYSGNNIYNLTFPDGKLFGYYGYLGNGWIYHVDLGYVYVSAGSGPEVYLWDLSTGHWWYTNSGSFPYLYDFSLRTWIYYFPDTHNAGHYTTAPRSFANMTTGQILTW